MKTIAIAGAGLSGAVVAYELAKTNRYMIDVYESRGHVGGNCHTEQDLETGVLVHKYGPHIFHTSNEAVWKYVSFFDEFVPFINRVKAITNKKIYSLPINLLTINQFFGETFSPIQAREFIANLGDKSRIKIETFEDQALRYVGKELYEAFFKDYTIKQWGVMPSKLPSSILKRLPIRFNYDDNYYNSIFQGIPKHGYTYIMEKMLDHPNIRVHLGSSLARSDNGGYTHLFYSGPIDGWFDFSEGRLAYRTLDFVEERFDGDYQGNAVINYCDMSVPWTRISEHKHFSTWKEYKKTIIYKEYSRACDETDVPFYPIPLATGKKLLEKYMILASNESKITFMGRLGTYRYLDMHNVVAEALAIVKTFLESMESNEPMPTFCHVPV